MAEIGFHKLLIVEIISRHAQVISGNHYVYVLNYIYIIILNSESDMNPNRCVADSKVKYLLIEEI